MGRLFLVITIIYSVLVDNSYSVPSGCDSYSIVLQGRSTKRSGERVKKQKKTDYVSKLSKSSSHPPSVRLITISQ